MKMSAPADHPLPPYTFDAERFDLDQVIVSYDRESDTLMVHLFGRGQPGVSVAVDGYWFLRMDREKKRLQGIQIESFLSRVAREDPAMLDALDVAELRGITLEEVARLRREIAATRPKRRTIDELFARFPQISQSLSRAS